MDLCPCSTAGWTITVRNQTNIHAMDDTNWCGEDPASAWSFWYKLSVDVPTEVRTVHTYVSTNFNTLIAV